MQKLRTLSHDLLASDAGPPADLLSAAHFAPQNHAPERRSATRLRPICGAALWQTGPACCGVASRIGSGVRRGYSAGGVQRHSTTGTLNAGGGEEGSDAGGGLSRGSMSSWSSSTTAGVAFGALIFGAFGVHPVRFCTTDP